MVIPRTGDDTETGEITFELCNSQISILVEGNGTYRLKPVIRTVESAIRGSIQGEITPIGILASVTATSGDLPYSSNVNISGNFMLMGLPA